MLCKFGMDMFRPDIWDETFYKSTETCYTPKRRPYTYIIFYLLLKTKTRLLTCIRGCVRRATTSGSTRLNVSGMLIIRVVIVWRIRPKSSDIHIHLVCFGRVISGNTVHTPFSPSRLSTLVYDKHTVNFDLIPLDFGTSSWLATWKLQEFVKLK